MIWLSCVIQQYGIQGYGVLKQKHGFPEIVEHVNPN